LLGASFLFFLFGEKVMEMSEEGEDAKFQMSMYKLPPSSALINDHDN